MVFAASCKLFGRRKLMGWSWNKAESKIRAIADRLPLLYSNLLRTPYITNRHQAFEKGFRCFFSFLLPSNFKPYKAIAVCFLYTGTQRCNPMFMLLLFIWCLISGEIFCCPCCEHPYLKFDVSEQFLSHRLVSLLWFCLKSKDPIKRPQS